MTEPIIKKPEGQIEVTTKLYPFIGKGPNRKGYHIGNYKVFVNTDDLPFSDFDQVDHFIHNLYNYAKTRKNLKDFFVYHPEKMTFIPIKMTKKLEGGRRRNKTIKKKTSSRKTQKKREPKQ